MRQEMDSFVIRHHVTKHRGESNKQIFLLHTDVGSVQALAQSVLI